jgi:hypothetical protein
LKKISESIPPLISMFFRHRIQKLRSDLAFSIFVGMQLLFNSNHMLFIFMRFYNTTFQREASVLFTRDMLKKWWFLTILVN